MAFVWQPYGSWGGGHLGSPPSLDQCHSCHTSMSHRGCSWSPLQILSTWPSFASETLPIPSVSCCVVQIGWSLLRYLPFNPAGFHRDRRNHGQPDSLLERACVSFRTVVMRWAVSRGSQVWVINFQCCCLTINEVMAPGPDCLYLSDVSYLPADHSPLVRTLH